MGSRASSRLGLLQHLLWPAVAVVPERPRNGNSHPIDPASCVPHARKTSLNHQPRKKVCQRRAIPLYHRPPPWLHPHFLTSRQLSGSVQDQGSIRVVGHSFDVCPSCLGPSSTAGGWRSRAGCVDAGMGTASSCHAYGACRAKPGATGRTWQGNSSSSFLLPQLCRFGDMSVGLRLSRAIRKGLQVSSKPAGSTPPCQVPPGQESPLHSSTEHKCAAAWAR